MRRKSPKVVWLPQDPFFSLDAAGLDHASVMVAFGVVNDVVGSIDTIVAPVVRDGLQNPLTPTTSLADLYASGYRLRRIVGKFWVVGPTTPPDDDGTRPSQWVTIVGFIILRVDDQGQPLQAANPANYSGGIIENTESPWIWRRAWYCRQDDFDLGSPFPLGAANRTISTLQGNLGTGGATDGPHIDQKTARLVGPNERLFMVIDTIATVPADQGTQTTIQYTWDLRVLASLRSNIGNRRNASR